MTIHRFVPQFEMWVMMRRKEHPAWTGPLMLAMSPSGHDTYPVLSPPWFKWTGFVSDNDNDNQGANASCLKPPSPEPPTT